MVRLHVAVLWALERRAAPTLAQQLPARVPLVVLQLVITRLARLPDAARLQAVRELVLVTLVASRQGLACALETPVGLTFLVAPTSVPVASTLFQEYLSASFEWKRLEALSPAKAKGAISGWSSESQAQSR